jgi:tetratricopeptide (TPR) repeat protein
MVGSVYLQLHDYEAAEPHLERAVKIRREQLGEERFDTLYDMLNLGHLYIYQDRYDEAEPLLVKVLEVSRRQIVAKIMRSEDNTHPLLHFSFGGLTNMYWKQGRYDQLETLLIKTLEDWRCLFGEENVQTLDCMILLASLQAACPVAEFRDGAKAVELATKACELTNWKDSDYIFILAAAYAEAGDFDSAVKWQKKLIDLVPTDASTVLVGVEVDNEATLKLYKSGKPCRVIPKTTPN